eukprot:3809532-Pyramimonas_sp.AAC.1
MVAAAHYCDMGMEPPNGFDTDRMRMPTRSPEGAAPLRSSGPNRADGGGAPWMMRSWTMRTES